MYGRSHKRDKPLPKMLAVGDEVVVTDARSIHFGREGVIKDFYYFPKSRPKGYYDYGAVIEFSDGSLRRMTTAAFKRAPVDMKELVSTTIVGLDRRISDSRRKVNLMRREAAKAEAERPKIGGGSESDPILSSDLAYSWLADVVAEVEGRDIGTIRAFRDSLRAGVHYSSFLASMERRQKRYEKAKQRLEAFAVT